MIYATIVVNQCTAFVYIYQATIAKEEFMERSKIEFVIGNLDYNTITYLFVVYLNSIPILRSNIYVFSLYYCYMNIIISPLILLIS